MSRLSKLLIKNDKIVLGLMSGTSMDAIDAALVKINGSGEKTELEIVGFLSYPYESQIQEKLLRLNQCFSISEFAELDMIVGECFAESAKLCINKYLLDGVKPDLIGSHGQTIYHNPPSRNQGKPCTLQIGSIDVVAEKTGVTTVGDFRVRDIAAGGEGAPIIPYVDYLLFNRLGKTVVTQNIGGISNLTVINRDVSSLEAFDTGPGNMILDGLIRLHTDGEKIYDPEGQLASKGGVDYELLNSLLSDEYYLRQPPKSTGSEKYGGVMVNRLYKHVSDNYMKIEDLLRTVLELTVETIARSYERFVFPRHEVSLIVISGGGAANKFLMERLRTRLSNYEIVLSDEFGIPFQAKEAVGMAILANELLAGNYTNLPSCTGAFHKVPLGKIALRSNL